MKNIHWILAFIGIVTFACSPTKPNLAPQGDSLQVTGTISKKGWSKSGESYCAQGSGYYTIDITKSSDPEVGGSYVIDMEHFPADLDIADYVGKTVDYQGKLVEKSWEIDYDDGGQHPARPVKITPDGEVVEEEGPTTFSCWIFRIAEVRGE